MLERDTSKLSRAIEAAIAKRQRSGRGVKVKEHYTVLDIEGERIFYKTDDQTAFTSVVKKVEFESVLKRIYRTVPALRYKDFGQIDRWSKEARTVSEWHKSGIPAPEVVFATARAVAYRYIDNVPYKKLLIASYNPGALDQVLETYHAIRGLARSEKRVELLHSDCKLTNFLCDLNKRCAVAIDPGISFFPFVSLDDADTSLNLFFAFSLCTLEIDIKGKLRYLEQFASSVEASERDALRALNQEIPGFASRYFAARDAFLRVVTGQGRVNILARYTPQHVGLINHAFRSRRR